MTAVAPRARFDDLRPGRARAWELVDPVGLVRADRLEDVAPALAEVEAATRRGWWAGGWVAYEAGAALDATLPPRASPDPLVCFGLFRARRRVAPLVAGPPPPWPGDAPLAVGTTAAQHRAAVAEVHRRITAGDVYQVNLTARLHGPAPDDATALATRLGWAQRGGFHALVDTGDQVVVSASPELFLARSGAHVLSRPMKGTSARGRWPADDAARAAALLASPKERAELVMIIDLVRNDLGRVAQVGTVRADRAPRLEGYPTVWQLTARVGARLRPDVGLVSLLAATFPPGSVTGAPKTAACGLVHRLEDEPRGVYCGLVGWFGPGERARLAVAIRTAVIDRRSTPAALRYGAGGGITIDAEAAAEWRELQAKALVLTTPVPDAVFETLAWRPRRGLVRLERHLARLAAAAARWCLPYDEAAARERLAAAVAGRRSPARVRLELRGDGALSVLVADLLPAPERPVRLAVDHAPLDTADPRRSTKTTGRAALVERAARHPEADDVVLLGPGGALVETTVANLLVQVQGRWCTPPLAAGCLPGVGRAVLVAAGRVVERDLTLADLHAATALAVVSSLRGVRPAVLTPT